MFLANLPVKRVASPVVILLSACLLAGCISSGPPGEPALHEAIKQAIGNPEFAGLVGAGNWLPNWQGYAGMKATNPPSQVGVVAVTGSRLWFLQWSDTQGRFNVMKSVSCIEAKQVFLDKLGRGRMLVIQSSDSNFDSFEFTRDLGLVGHSEHAEQAYALISKERATRPLGK